MMNDKSLLGKSAPQSPQAPVKPAAKPGLFFLGSLVIACALGYSAVSSHYGIIDSQEEIAQTNQVSTLQTTTDNLRILGDSPQPATSDDCKAAITDKTLFPFIPKELATDGKCPPAQWNLAVALYLANKLLTFANWLAAAVAISLTVYAGILYLTGFNTKSNVETAKKLLISTYVGLIIVLLARLILYAPVHALQADSNTLDVSNDLIK